MRDRWKLGVGVVGVATTFSVVASAGFLQPPPGDARDTIVVAPAPSPLPALPPPAPASDARDRAAAVVTNVEPPAAPTPDLALSDPSLGGELPGVRARKAKPLPLDMADPWGRGVLARPKPAPAAVQAAPARALPSLPPARLDASDPWSAPPTRRAAPPPPSAPVDPWSAAPITQGAPAPSAPSGLSNEPLR